MSVPDFITKFSFLRFELTTHKHNFVLNFKITCKSVLGSLSFSSFRFWTISATWEEFKVIWHSWHFQSEFESSGMFGKMFDRQLWHFIAPRYEPSSVGSEHLLQQHSKYQFSWRVRRLSLKINLIIFETLIVGIENVSSLTVYFSLLVNSEITKILFFN